MKRQKGFTLVELVVVIAILGVLAGIAIPRFMGATASAKGAKLVADLRIIDEAATLYYTQNGTWPKQIPEGDTQDTKEFAGLLASWPKPTSGTFEVKQTNGTVKEFKDITATTYAFDGERATYDGHNLDYYLNDSAAAPSFGDDNITQKIAAIMAGIIASEGKHAIDSNATNGQWTPKVLEQLKAAGIDLEAMGAKTWGYTNDGMLYWTNADITGLKAGNSVPAIRYNSNTGTYTVWYCKVETKSNGTDTYNALVIDYNRPYKPSTTDTKNQTYADALKHLEDAQNSKN